MTEAIEVTKAELTENAAFAEWMAKVDTIFTERFGLDSSNFPDYMWIDDFTDHATPAEAVVNYLEEYGDELGMDGDDLDDGWPGDEGYDSEYDFYDETDDRW